MIREHVAADQDFWLFEPNVFSTTAEKRLIELLLEEDFIYNPWLQRRLGCYVQAETAERDRIVLDIVKFFFQHFLEKRFPSELFAVVREFDSVFASLGKKGHFVHQFEVLVFGWALIRMLIKQDKGLWKPFCFYSPREIFSVWAMTSVIHDFGYPLEAARDVMKRFFEWYRALGMSEVAELYQRLMKKYKKIRDKNLTEFKSREWGRFNMKGVLLEALRDSLKISISSAERLLESIEEDPKGKIHGYAGALVLCEKCFQSWPKKLTGKELQNKMTPLKLAMAAICLHDLPEGFDEYISRIDFWRNPYAYLLFLVDNLQEWFRNLRPNEAWPSYNLLEINRKNNELQLSYILTHERWTRDVERRAQTSVHEKLQRLSLMAKPRPPLNFQIIVDFRTSHGQSLGTNTIFL